LADPNFGQKFVEFLKKNQKNQKLTRSQPLDLEDYLLQGRK